MKVINDTYHKQRFNISSDMYYYIVNANEINSDIDTFELLERLSNEEKDKYYRLRKEEDKKTYLCARTVLREEFINNLGIPFDQEISFNKYKKPFLVNYPDIHFNISHSGSYVMLGFSKYPIGVDIEKIVTYSKSTIMKLSKIVFHESEMKLLLEQNENEARYLFTKLWTLKESFTKAIGKGFYADTKSFIVNNIKSGIPDISLKTYERFHLYFGMYNDEMAVSVSYN
jgi:4'-phosphopantetheinyl transferase